MGKEKSFTLIELMVGIAIMGLIATIVLVSLKGARERARIAASLQFSDSLRASLSDALVSWWNFNEGTGNTAGDTWEGNTGTIYGASWSWTTGVAGNALSYGGNDYVRASGPSLNNIKEGITLELWFKTSVSQISKALLMKYEPSLYATEWAILLNSSTRMDFYVRTFDGGWRNVSNPTPITFNDNAWHHVVGTYDGRYQKLYIDSNLVRSYDWGSIKSLRAENKRVSIVPGGGDIWAGYQGLIDEVRIYSRGLTALEIQKRYAEGLKKFQLVER